MKQKDKIIFFPIHSTAIDQKEEDEISKPVQSKSKTPLSFSEIIQLIKELAKLDSRILEIRQKLLDLI